MRPIATLLAACLLVLAGCTTPSSNGAREPARAPEWPIATIGKGPALLVWRAMESTRSAERLVAIDTTSGAERVLWTAPAGWDGRLLTAEKRGIAISLLRTDKPDHKMVKTAPEGKHEITLHVDQRLVELLPDGRVIQSDLPTSALGAMSSAAFVGSDLLIAMTAPSFNRGWPKQALVYNGREFLQAGLGRLSSAGAIDSQQIAAFTPTLGSIVPLVGADSALGAFQDWSGPPSLGVIEKGPVATVLVRPTFPKWGVASEYTADTTGTIVFPMRRPGDHGDSSVSLAQLDLSSAQSTPTVLHRAVWASLRWPSALPSVQSRGDGTYLIARSLDPLGDDIVTGRAALSLLHADGTQSVLPVTLYDRTRPTKVKALPDAAQDSWRWLRSFGE